MNMGFGDTPSSPTGTGSHSNFGGNAAASISEGPLQPYVDPTLDAHSIDEHRVEVLERLGFAREAVLKSVTDTKYDAPHAAYMLLAFKLVHTHCTCTCTVHMHCARTLHSTVYSYQYIRLLCSPNTVYSFVCRTNFFCTLSRSFQFRLLVFPYADV